MTAPGYLNADEDVPTCTCITFENTETWRQELRDMVTQGHSSNDQLLWKMIVIKRVMMNLHQAPLPLAMKLLIAAMTS